MKLPQNLMVPVLLLLTGIFLPLGRVESQEPAVPKIDRLDNRDMLFRQYLADVEAARRRIFNQRDAEIGGAAHRAAGAAEFSRREASLAEGLTIYAYTPQSGEDLLDLAARCTIPYAALVTLNRLPAAAAELSGGILLPSIPGLFIPDEPRNDLEMLLSSTRNDGRGVPLTVRRGGKTERFRFIPGGDFTPTERTFFLHPGFRFPLRNYRLTSAFGPRINPVTGNPRFHEGLDLAAPEGSEVFASRKGVVAEQGYDPIYGNYIIINHGDWSSLYGHLSEIRTTLRNNVESGSLIGRVGSTGQSTGPHLHFELRQKGVAQDPERYLLLFKEGIRQ
jgi:murein DD-endopeptidase MepM/ murein hydrolase activator NlpD